VGGGSFLLLEKTLSWLLCGKRKSRTGKSCPEKLVSLTRGLQRLRFVYYCIPNILAIHLIAKAFDRLLHRFFNRITVYIVMIAILHGCNADFVLHSCLWLPSATIFWKKKGGGFFLLFIQQFLKTYRSDVLPIEPNGMNTCGVNI